jgi:N-acetylmuramoyl-L-alanine amidase
VRDLQARLGRLGYASTDSPAAFGDGTEAAVRHFQRERGLAVDGVGGIQTWSALVEAGFALGDRLLYLRQPMLRGDDVADLQRRLGTLGFDAGRVDGIFGPRTAAALDEFQRNAGLTADVICGPDTIAALRRLGSRAATSVPVSLLREEEGLRAGPRGLRDRRIAVSHGGGLDAVADALARTLHDGGSDVVVILHPDPSNRAAEANQFGAEVVVDLAVHDGEVQQVAYYATEGFESVGGRRLAALLAAGLTSVLGPTDLCGMRLPVLRETRMPAVACQLGSPATLVRRTPELTAAIHDALACWADVPLDG